MRTIFKFVVSLVNIAMTSILIRNGFIVTMNDERKVYKRGNLYIEDDRIVSVGEQVDVSSPEYVIDAEHKIVLPGFVNTHAHLQQYFRGVYELIGDFYKVNLPLEMYRRPEDMDWLGQSSCAELIYGGCTTTTILYTYPEGFARAVERAGNRVILGADIEEVNLDRLSEGVYEYLPEKGEEAFKRAVDLYMRWHNRAGGRIKVIMAPKAPDLVRPETYLRCKEFAEEKGLRMTTHLSQSRREVQQVKKLYGKTPPKHLFDLGVMDDKLTGAHCTYITEGDLQLIKETGMGILHCRAVTNPLTKWMDLGIPVGLGTDDYFHDMLQLMRQNIYAADVQERLGLHRFRRPTFYELLELATRKGAEVMGIADEVGSIEPGKKADVIIVDMMNPYLTPTMNPLTSLVFYGSSSNIETVIVDGRILKMNGKLTTIDLKSALLKAQRRVEEIINRFFEDHPDQRRLWEKRKLG